MYAPLWDEGNVSAPLFFGLCRRLGMVWAVSRVNMTNAVMIGTGLVMVGKGFQKLADKDNREAFPSANRQ